MKRLVFIGCLLLFAAAVTPIANSSIQKQPLLGTIDGRIEIPRIGVSADIIEGREAAQLDRGPSHAPESGLPGEGIPMLIAGHRTTYGAWFRHIDELRRGDVIIVHWKAAYGGTVRYEVSGHRVVAENAERQVFSSHREVLILSACNPLHSHAQRWVVYAFPTK